MGSFALRFTWVAAAVLALAACDRLGLEKAAPAPPLAEASTPAPDLTPFVGRSYADFVAAPGMQRYSIAAMGLSDAERARFARVTATPAVGVMASGGGLEALVFSGCAAGGCLDGLGVVAIDAETGDVFVGVSDMSGVEELVPNDRLEALLRLTSPSRTWDDPIRPAAAAAAPAP